MIAAMDIDLHKIYCVDDRKRVHAKASSSPDEVFTAIYPHVSTLLIEVASPVMYMSDAAANHNVLRWALWNMSAAQQLSSSCKEYEITCLVAPSHVWTCGHALKLRHEVAGCVMKQKDLRECEAMIYYYKQSPEKWVPLKQYLEEL